MGHRQARMGEVRENNVDSAAARKYEEQNRAHAAFCTPCIKFKPHASSEMKEPPRASKDCTLAKTPGCPQLPCAKG